MTQNLLKLNEEKTELIYFQSRFLCEPFSTPSLTLGGEVVAPVPVVKNLGCHLDQHLSLETQVSNTVKTCCYHLRSISKIRNSLDDEACKTLVVSTILSRLDYCNAILAGAPAKLLERLQRMQNMAARLITRTPRSDDVTPHLKARHWLPVQQRIDHTKETYVFKSLHDAAPGYLSELISTRELPESIRSAAGPKIFRKKWRTKTYGGRGFTAVAPKVWNKLPTTLCSATTLTGFKKNLKTHLFKTYFNTRRS